MAETTKENQFQLTWLPKKTFEILVTINWKEIGESQAKALAEAGKTIEVKGFRKGKAPEKMVAETIGQNKLLELTLQQLLPGYYEKAITKLGLKPIVAPKIGLVSSKEGEDWQIKFTSCEEPEINLGSYKDEIKKLKAAKAIWTPDKELPKKDEDKPASAEATTDKEEKLHQALDWLVKNVKVEICELLIEEEVTRRLSNLLEQTQKLGLTVDQYLNSVGKSVNQIKEEFKNSAQENLAVEFILGKIADAEKIEVSDEEMAKVLSQAKTEEEKKALEAQKYYLATLLRRQKTLDFLASL